MDTVSPFEKYTADYIAIRQLIDQYNDIVNHRNWQEIPDMFTQDAIWQASAPINMSWTGLDDIKIKLPASVERMDVLIQSTSGVVIRVEDTNRATARSLLSEFGRNKETGEGMHSIGSYEDVLVKENGTWLFSRRVLTLLYNDALPVPGNVKDYKY